MHTKLHPFLCLQLSLPIHYDRNMHTNTHTYTKQIYKNNKRSKSKSKYNKVTSQDRMPIQQTRMMAP